MARWAARRQRGGWIRPASQCQSIIGALGCAPSSAHTQGFLSQRVSRSLARWAARHQDGPHVYTNPVVSVDHWRAGLRAVGNALPPVKFPKCQSIIGALGCAPILTLIFGAPQHSVSRSLARWAARQPLHLEPEQRTGCQSIIGALGCAPSLPLLAVIGCNRVSRSLARWAARRTPSVRQ